MRLVTKLITHYLIGYMSIYIDIRVGILSNHRVQCLLEKMLMGTLQRSRQHGSEHDVLTFYVCTKDRAHAVLPDLRFVCVCECACVRVDSLIIIFMVNCNEQINI